MNLPEFKVRYLRKLLNYPLGGLTIDPEEARKGLEYLGPKRKSEKVRASRRAARAEDAKKIAAQQMTTAEIRAFDMRRAGGFCECGCARVLDAGHVWNAPEMDHFQGGSGQKKQKQTIKNTWILALGCHRLRQHNQPTTAYWNARFREHCERHGYPVLQHVEHKPLPRRGTA